MNTYEKIWHINDPHIQLAALFGTGLAPIAGHYGCYRNLSRQKRGEVLAMSLS